MIIFGRHIDETHEIVFRNKTSLVDRPDMSTFENINQDSRREDRVPVRIDFYQGSRYSWNVEFNNLRKKTKPSV